MRLTLVLPPLTQLNTPYPSTAYLARFLRRHGVETRQRDLGLELALRVLSRPGLEAVFDQVEALAEQGEELPEPAWRAMALRSQHERAVGPAVALLQGRSRSLASRVLHGDLLPLTPRLEDLDLEAFGSMGNEDAARFLATRYLADLADLVRATVDGDFALASYGSHLALGPVQFGPIAERLAETTLVDAWLDELTDSLLTHPEGAPDVVGLSVPFPGTLVAALRMGGRLKQAGVTVMMGGGYVNTELREVDQPELWDCVDALTYDDGEGPLLAFLRHLEGGPDLRHRTRTREGLIDQQQPQPKAEGAAWYGDLDLSGYLRLVDSLNPTHRLWSDGRWNKITLAHGCYWKRCAFCDVNLDYIARFEPNRVDTLVDAMVELRDATGESGFHFVDEAAPPRVMRDLALALLHRGETMSWWGNIRFERAFTPDLCRLLAAAGLIAVTGGLEVASDRLLKLMDKGITVEQAARAGWAFRSAGVGVHAYLMYGFPTQTAQETIDAMEVVRQMFEAGVLDSAFWHRFVLTRHSDVAQDPEHYGVRIGAVPEGTFAANDLPHEDPRGAHHDDFDEGLVAALGAWMQGRGLDEHLAAWFEHRVPATIEPRGRVREVLHRRPMPMQPKDRLVWLGGTVLEGEDDQGPVLVLHHNGGTTQVHGREEELDWLAEVLNAATPGGEPLRFSQAHSTYPGEWRDLQRRWNRVRRAGLVGV